MKIPRLVPMLLLSGTACVWLVSSVSAATDQSVPSTFDRLVSKAETAESKGKYKRAARYYRKSIVHAVDGRTKGMLTRKQADCLVKHGDTRAAYEAYKELLEAYPLYVPYEQVISQLREIAERYVIGEGTFFGLADEAKGAEVYELIVRETPVGRAAVGDHMRLGDLQTELNRPEDAVETYREVLRLFPELPEAADASFELGRLLINLSETGDGDGRLTRRALRHLNSFLSRTPEHPRAPEARRLLAIASERQAERLCGLGEFYLRAAHRRQKAAVRYLSDVVRKYPETTSATQAEILLAQVEGREADFKSGDGERSAVMPAPEVPSGAPSPEDLPPPKQFRPLKERENLNKWLLPLPDVNKLDAGDAG